MIVYSVLLVASCGIFGLLHASGLQCYRGQGDASYSLVQDSSGPVLPPLVANCSTCQKYTVSYFMKPSANTVQYQCVQTTSAVDTFSCQGSVTIVAYADGSMVTRSCTCCSDRCNDGQFCTDSDPLIYNIIPNSNGKIITPQLAKQCNAAGSLVTPSTRQLLTSLIFVILLPSSVLRQ